MGTTENGWTGLDSILGPPWGHLVSVDKDDSGSGGTDDDDTDDQDDATTGSGDDDDTDEDADGKKFTQADLDTLVSKARRDERKRARARADNGKKGGKPFDQEDDEDDDVRSLRRELSELRAEQEHGKLMDAAREAAVDAGADPKRVRRFLRLADLDGIKSTDADAIADAITDALDENPEFRKVEEKADDEEDDKPKRKRAKASSRDDTSEKGKRQWTREDIAKIAGTPEYDKHREEIQAAVRAGSVK
jgi:hypothetical protein